MTAAEFTGALERLGWSTSEAAKRLASAPRSVRQWKAGSRKVSGPVVALLQGHLTPAQ